MQPRNRIGVLLLHGLAGSPAELQSVAKPLQKLGYTVHCPLLAGHGGTQKALQGSTWPEWAASAQSALYALQKETDIIMAGGLCAGAVLALHLAQQCQAAGQPLLGLSLFAPTLHWDGWAIPKLRWLLPAILRLPVVGKRYVFKEQPPYGIQHEGLRARIVAARKRRNPGLAGHPFIPGQSIAQLAELIARVKGELHTLVAPTLLVHADHDDFASIEGNSLFLQQHLGGPTTLLRLTQSYHMVTIDQERRAVARATIRFLESLV